MAPVLDDQARLVAEFRHHAAAAARQLGLRRKQIQDGEHFDVRLDLRRVCADPRRERLQNALNLALLLDLQRAHAIVALECRQRLDEERLAARARIVHDAGHHAGELRFDRNDEASVPNRNDAILNRFGILRAVEDRGDAVTRFALRRNEAPPDSPERGRGAIQNDAAFVDRIDERMLQFAQRRVWRDDRSQIRMFAYRLVRGRGRRQRVADRTQLGRPQRCADLRGLAEGGRIDRRHDRDVGACRERSHRLRAQLLPAHDRKIRFGQQVVRQRAAALRSGRGDDTLAHSRKVERVEGASICEAHRDSRATRASSLPARWPSAGSAFPREAFIT